MTVESEATEALSEARAGLEALGFLPPGAACDFTALAGGVSSDIWRVDLPAGVAQGGVGRSVCVKRARARLKVAALWEVPVDRNHYEAEYLRVAGEIAPAFVPSLLAEDQGRGMIVMPYYDASSWSVWKAELLAGKADPAVARQVGAGLGRIHQQAAGRADLAQRFATDALFHGLRLDPYLAECARRHSDLAPRLSALITTTANTRLTLVHGDVSPKNILIGAEGVRLLDAECAWYGDPAFDLAFCLNHLLLKAVWHPPSHNGYAACFEALLQAYWPAVTWEPLAALQARVAALLPGLMLARVDGKSPVEYLGEEADKAFVRHHARQLLFEPVATPAALAATVYGALTP